MEQVETTSHVPGVGLSGALPPEVQALCPRMREIATIVYLNGPASTRDVQARISDTLSVYGIRTMLNRLARKGIVSRRPSGCHSEIVYLPAIMTERVRELALRRFIERNFDSTSTALQSALRLIGDEKGRSRLSQKHAH
jgi:predicted transcriptional regulator